MKSKIPKTRYLLFASLILIMSLAISCKKNSVSDVAYWPAVRIRDRLRLHIIHHIMEFPEIPLLFLVII